MKTSEDTFGHGITPLSFPKLLVTTYAPYLLLADDSLRTHLQNVQYSSRFAVAIRLPEDLVPPVKWMAMYVNDNPCVRFVALDTVKRGKGEYLQNG